MWYELLTSVYSEAGFTYDTIKLLTLNKYDKVAEGTSAVKLPSVNYLSLGNQLIFLPSIPLDTIN